MGRTRQGHPTESSVHQNSDYPASLPDSLDDLKAIVTSRRVDFPERLREIGIFAFQQPHQMAFLSIRDIAKATHTSSSSVHRFAKTLGFEDYGALRKVFQKHIAAAGRHHN